jgi:hypothetical protein
MYERGGGRRVVISWEAKSRQLLVFLVIYLYCSLMKDNIPVHDGKEKLMMGFRYLSAAVLATSQRNGQAIDKYWYLLMYHAIITIS